MKRELWKESNRAGGAILIYKAVMVAVILVIMIAAIVVSYVNTGFDSIITDTAATGESATQPIAPSDEEIEETIDVANWGYIVAMGICAFIFLLWKKKSYFTKIVLLKNRPMTGITFALAFSAIMACQFIANVTTIGLEAIFNYFGKTASELIEAGSGNTSDFVLILYIGVLAPIAEELLFRGIVLRGMRPYGKGIAIFVSSILFACIHGNPIQIPFAFVSGIMLAYITLEYDIRWAILLHVINNLGFGIVLYQLCSGNVLLGDMISGGIIVACTVVTIITAVIRKNNIKRELATWKTEGWQWKAVMTAPTILITLIASLMEMLFLILTTV